MMGFNCSEGEIIVHGDYSVLLHMYHLLYSMKDSSSNQIEPCGLLIDGLCVGFEKKKKDETEGLKASGRRGWCVEGGVSQMSSTLRKKKIKQVPH